MNYKYLMYFLFAFLVSTTVLGEAFYYDHVNGTEELADKISTKNSTTTVLGAGDTFSGQWEEMPDYSQIQVFYNTNVASAANGIEVQMSTNKVNLDKTITFSSTASAEYSEGNGGHHIVEIPTRYFRVRYTNGGSPQTKFRLQTTFINATTPDSIAVSISDTINVNIASSDTIVTNPIAGGAALPGHLISANETGNSTQVLLGGGATFTGAWEDVTNYSTAAVTILGSDASATGTLFIDLSTNGGSTFTSLPRTISDITFDLPHVITIIESHFRIRYVNDATPQTGTFSIQTKYSNAGPLGINHLMGDVINAKTEGQLVKAVTTGEKPDGDYGNIPHSGVDPNNSSTTTLIAVDTFVGAWTQLEGFHGISVLPDGSAAATAPGNLHMQFSHDSITVHRDIVVSVDDIASAPPRTLGAVAKFFRVKYANGAQALTSFDLQTMLHTEQVELVSRLDQTLQGNEDVKTVRSVITGETPKGEFKNVPITPIGDLQIAINEPISAFGDLRTSELTPQFQGSFEYTVGNSELTDSTTTNGGTVSQANAMAVCQTSTTTASTAELKSRFHARYRAGLGGNLRFTAIFSAGAAGTEQLIGLADETGSSQPYNNGYMIGYVGTTFGVHRFSNDAITTTALSSCDDPLDGSGRTGMTVDLTKLNVFQIEYQYLGGGDITFSIKDDVSGKYVPFHTIRYANTATEPNVYNPNFHFTMWVDNGATTSDVALKSASYAYFVEGKTTYFEVHQPQQSSSIRSKATVTSEVAIFTIRNKSSYASKTNYIDIVLEYLSTSIEASSANNLGEVRLIKNAILGGSPSYTDINATDSVVEIDVAGTTVSGGVTLPVVALAGKNDKGLVNLADFSIIIHPGETVTLAGQSANSATIKGALLWKEIF